MRDPLPPMATLDRPGVGSPDPPVPPTTYNPYMHTAVEAPQRQKSGNSGPLMSIFNRPKVKVPKVDVDGELVYDDLPGIISRI